MISFKRRHFVTIIVNFKIYFYKIPQNDIPVVYVFIALFTTNFLHSCLAFSFDERNLYKGK